MGAIELLTQQGATLRMRDVWPRMAAAVTALGPQHEAVWRDLAPEMFNGGRAGPEYAPEQTRKRLGITLEQHEQLLVEGADACTRALSEATGRD